MIPTRPSDKVLPGDPRPAGPSDACFYCDRKVGEDHAAGCVILQRYVVVRMEVEYVVSVPRDWDQEQIQFARNLSTWCATNDLRGLVAAVDSEDPGCGCGCTRFDYRREATATDLKDLLVLGDDDRVRGETTS